MLQKNKIPFNLRCLVGNKLSYTTKIHLHLFENLLNILPIWDRNCFCPCCGIHMNHMFTVDYPKITDFLLPVQFPDNTHAVCPICGSYPRHRILAYYLKKKDMISKLRNKNVIYFAEENCMKLFMEKQGIHSKSADINGEADLYVNMENMPFDDSSIDVIICNHVLEHVGDYRRALHEVHRVITGGGNVSLHRSIKS